MLTHIQVLVVATTNYKLSRYSETNNSDFLRNVMLFTGTLILAPSLFWLVTWSLLSVTELRSVLIFHYIFQTHYT